MLQPLTIPTEEQKKRFDTNYYVEGFATTFDAPYLLYEFDGVKYFETIDRHALDGADMSDIIMQYDHRGTVFARTKMGKGKEPSLIVEPQEHGLFVSANLGLTEEARRLFANIDTGLIYKMSWAFTVADDEYDNGTHTRTIHRIKKVYDVSAVSIPANNDTDISARSYFDGVIEAERRESLERRRKLIDLKLKIAMED